MAEAPHEAIRRWRERPDAMVRELFGVTPDAWQDEVLRDFPTNPQQVMACCKGPGKTAVLAWLCWNFLLTRRHPKIGALSISADNLRDNLWSEMSKWRSQDRSGILKSEFEVTATRIHARAHAETWFMSSRSWSKTATAEEQGQALAGLWADNVMVVIDEAGGVPVGILRVAAAMMANAYSSQREGHLMLAGNTTSRDGSLYHAAIDQRAEWKVYEITADPDDPKRTPRIPAEYAAKQIELYSRDDPWVRINILALFPLRGLNSFISEDEVRAAQKRHLEEYHYRDYPLIVGVDVARFGDDETVFFPRRGKISYPPMRMRLQDTVQVAGHLSAISNEKVADSVQIDASGGLGAGVLDVYLKLQGNGLGVEFGGAPRDPKRFRNKRAEMYWDMMEWIKGGGALPPVPEMVKGLATMTYAYTLKGQLQVEDKDQIKERLGRSPDLEDALACSFAHVVAIKPRHVIHGTLSGAQASVLEQLVSGSAHVTGTAYDPWDRGIGKPTGDRDY